MRKSLHSPNVNSQSRELIAASSGQLKETAFAGFADARLETAQLLAKQALMARSPQIMGIKSLQMQMNKSNLQCSGSVIPREGVAQLAKHTWTGGVWVSSGASSSTAKVPKPVGDFEGQVFDDDTGVYTQQESGADADEARIAEAEVQAQHESKESGEPPVPGLLGVGFSAGKHIWGVAIISKGNNPNPASFSFAKESTIRLDIELVNKYLVNGKAGGVGVQVLEGNKYKITVSRSGQTRIYEVHKDHSLQAFPVSGDGVLNKDNAGCNFSGVEDVAKKTRGNLAQLAPKKMLAWHTNANRINGIISLGN